MAGKIFINYRRGESSHLAGRLHERLGNTIGRHKLFMDVDNIPAGIDFAEHLNSQLAQCDVMLSVISPNWLDARDETGRRRLDNPEDFVAIEIATALARAIPVIPVLVDGATMPKAGDLPEALKPLARRNAVQIHHANFGSDADALINKMGLAQGPPGLGRRSVLVAVGIAALAVLLLIGWAGYALIRTYVEHGLQHVELKPEQQRKEAQAKATHKAGEAEQQQQQGTAQADQTKAAMEAESKRKAEMENTVSQAMAAWKSGDYDRAIAISNEAIRLDPNYAPAFNYRGNAYTDKGDLYRAIADFNEAIRLDPKYAKAFHGRGLAYARRGDNEGALADYNEAIRLDPQNAPALSGRGYAYARKGDNERAFADYNEAIRLDPQWAPAFNGRGVVYADRGDYDRAFADYNEAIRLNPKFAPTFLSRGLAYANRGDNKRAIADYTEAIRLNPKNGNAFCNRGIAKRRSRDSTAEDDIARARQLGRSYCQ